MALPDSRDETIVDGASTVKASLLNNLQDAIVRHEQGKYDSKTTMVPAAAGAPGDVAENAVFTAGGWSFSSVPSATPFLFPITLDVGVTLEDVRAYVFGAIAPANLTFKVFKVNQADGTPTQLGATQTAAQAATYQTLDVSGIDEVTVDGYGYFGEVEVDSGGHIALGLRVTHKKV